MASSGYSIEGLVKLTVKAENIDPTKRDSTVQYIASQLNRNIGFHRSGAKVIGTTIVIIVFGI